MADATAFFTVMAAMSTSVQTFVDHALKKRIKWMDTHTQDDPANEQRRQSAIHLASFVAGSVLAYSLGIKPLAYLDVESGLLGNSLLAGLMVSFGGSFFNEALGVLREFKKSQEELKKQRG